MHGHQVLIAADGRPYDFLNEIFPDFKFIRLPGTRIRYPSGKWMALKMLVQSPSIIFNIYKENQRLKKIIKMTGADVVISDNRFGLWSKKTYSIYMTHQVMIKAPQSMKWAEPWLYRLHRWFIGHYDECWIPDLPGEPNLSGDLSHKYPLPINAKFIGILSRFENNPRPPTADRRPPPDLLILLSGPEPQRSIFEEIIFRELDLHRGLHVVILQGLPGERNESYPIPGVAVFNHLPDKEIAGLIAGAGLIICRPGYSTLMDLVTLGRSAVLVPTPGQTEQEYLAETATKRGSFFSVVQDRFNLDLALDKGRGLMPPVSGLIDQSILDKHILNLASILRGNS